MTNFGDTEAARRNREAKAALLAEACRRRGVHAAAIAGWTDAQRRTAARDAGVNPPRPHSPTWTRVIELLKDRATWDTHDTGAPRVIETPPQPSTVACGFWVNGAYCGADPARPYLPGPRCPDHTPAAVAGRPEPSPEPDSTLEALLARKVKPANLGLASAAAAE